MSSPTRSSDDPRSWQAALDLVEQLLELPHGERDDALARTGADPEVRRLAKRLLEAHAHGGVLDGPLHPSLTPQATRSDLVGQRLGRWLLTAPIGHGGMSVVYRARSLEPPVGQEAALKLLSLGAATPAGRARFEREIDILVRLRHPGIAPVHDAGTAADGTPWFAMALVEGVDIEAWCTGQSLDPEARVDLFLQVCDAVEHAHRHLVIHRDIKPSNVMVNSDGRVVLLDFGISRMLEDGEAEAASTGTYAFTPRYAAPEQLRGGPITTATDVYSLGCLLHMLLLGVAPEPGDVAASGECRDPAKLVDRRGDPALRRLVAGDMGAIIRKALAHDPVERYPGAAELACDLRAWRGGRPVAAREGGDAYRFKRFVARHKLTSALILALFASLLAGVAGFAWQAQRAMQEADAALASKREADAAQMRAHSARERAEALNRFILDLFEADLPTRPLDELPTTAELLDLGVVRARDPASGAAAMRAQMLTAIGRIHGLRARRAVSMALADEAIDLARSDPEGDGDVLAGALMLRAQLAMGESDNDGAWTLLEEAAGATLVDGQATRLHLEVRREQGAVLANSHRAEESVQVLEQLLHDAEGREDVPEAFLVTLRADLAMDYAALRRHEAAQGLYEQVLAARARHADDDLLRYTITLANSANNLISLGHFDEASRRIDAVLGAYDRLFDAPNSYRSAARMIRGYLLLRQGRPDDALVEFDSGSREWALSQGEDPEQSLFLPYYRLTALVAGERWTDVEREGRAARQRFLPLATNQRDRLVRVEAWLSQALCRRGDAAAGEDVLSAARMRVDSPPLHDVTLRAMLDESHAHCLAARGQLDAALAALDDAGAYDDSYPPGEALDLARRDHQRAQWLETAMTPEHAAYYRSRAQARADGLALPNGRPWQGATAPPVP